MCLLANRLSAILIPSIALVGECEPGVLFHAAGAQQAPCGEGARLAVEVADGTLYVEAEDVPLNTVVDAISECGGVQRLEQGSGEDGAMAEFLRQYMQGSGAYSP